MASHLTNYVSYLSKAGPRIGHYSLEKATIQPLSFASGTPLCNLYQVIEIGADQIRAAGDPIPASSVKILPPITGRDILAVGKNYSEHAKEFNSSGFDSSDKVDIPTHPVIFTKRATSIIASGQEIYPHPEFTQTVDYEGEIGVIIGKAGLRITEEDALSHVWGYTIINDVTARERQRDHKQFFLGKSPDTFCPMGPIAVPAKDLPTILHLQTYVNGELRQEACSEDLIFSIPHLIKTVSECQTLQPGDVIATGTPAGVGIGRSPPVFLKPGDTIDISVTGLGTLSNRIGSHYPPVWESLISTANNRTFGTGLTTFGGKELWYSATQGDSHIVFIHGLGGNSELFSPLITLASLSSHALHRFDLEGHGLSPTSALSAISIESYARDVAAIFAQGKISQATVISHSMGCLIAIRFALDHPNLVKNLILLGPPATPFPEPVTQYLVSVAAAVRGSGMPAICDAVVEGGLFKKANPLAVTALRLSLLGQDPEGYAKGVTALAGMTTKLDIASLKVHTLIVTGDEDQLSPVAVCRAMAEEIEDCQLVILEGVGHLHVFEDPHGVAEAVKSFL